MQALWAQFGKPGQKEPGKVGTAVHHRRTEGNARERRRRSRRSPTTSSRSTSKAASSSTTRKLLGRAGLVMRKRAPGKAVCRPGAAAAGGSALRVAGLVPWESPLYKAGVAQDDQLVNLDGTALTSMAN